MLFTGFFGLLQLNELSSPDDNLNLPLAQDWGKVIRRNTVTTSKSQFKFLLPGHSTSKAIDFFEGNCIVLISATGFLPGQVVLVHHDVAIQHFLMYLSKQDALHSLHPVDSPLWLTEAGLVPTRSFFMLYFHQLFPEDIGVQSMRAGGARWLAENGVSPLLIKDSACWASGTEFQIYTQYNPTGLLHTSSTNPDAVTNASHVNLD